MFDFNKMNSRIGSTVGFELHIKHPVTGELMYNDAPKNTEPCIVIVLGTEGHEVQKLVREINRAKMRDDKKPKPGSDEFTMSELHMQMCEAAVPLVAGFKNVLKGDVQATKADAMWFLDMQMVNGQEGEKSFVEQVVDCASKRANYLGNVSSV